MRIAVLSKRIGSYGGAALAVAFLIQEWLRRPEIELHLIYERDSLDLATENERLITYPLEHYSPRQILRTLKEVACDVVYGVDHYAFLAVLAGRPLIFCNHSNLPGALTSDWRTAIAVGRLFPGYAANAKLADCVIDISEYGLRWTSVLSRSSVLVRNGVRFPKANVQKLWGAKTVATLGSFGHRKGKLTARVIAVLLERIPDVDVYIVGRVSQPDLLTVCRHTRCHELGFMADPLPVLAGADVFVLSSLMENLALSACEAAACATPIVTFDVGGMGELVTHKTGRLIPKYNIEGMCAAIEELLADRSTRVACGHEARRRVANWTWARAAAFHFELFEEVVRSRGSHG